jgi:chromosome partitioning protein
MAAVVIAIATLKGGVGKSTLTQNLAECLHGRGYNTVIVDRDARQRTCARWGKLKRRLELDGPDARFVKAASLRSELARLSAGFDAVLIDTAPQLGRRAREALLCADFVILVVVPGVADVWALKSTIRVLTDARQTRPELLAGVVLNKARERTHLTDVAREALAELVELGLPTLGELHDTVKFGVAMAQGMGVVTTEPDSQAATEVGLLVDAVIAALRAKVLETTDRPNGAGQ